MHFSAWDSSFFFVKYGQGYFLQGHFLRHNFFFMISLCINVFSR